jgi:hypothetical protein
MDGVIAGVFRRSAALVHGTLFATAALSLPRLSW